MFPFMWVRFRVCPLVKPLDLGSGFVFIFCADGERQCPSWSSPVWEERHRAKTPQCRSEFKTTINTFKTLRLSELTLGHYFPGIDVNIVDQKGMTALDTVKDMPSKKSREIAALIHGKGKICPREPLGKAPFGFLLRYDLFACCRSHDWKNPHHWPTSSTHPSTSGESQSEKEGWDLNVFSIYEPKKLIVFFPFLKVNMNDYDCRGLKIWH